MGQFNKRLPLSNGFNDKCLPIQDHWLVHYRSVQHDWSITGRFNMTGPLQVGSTWLVHYRSVQHGGFQSPVVACRHRSGVQLDAGLATGHHCVPRTNTVWGGIPASRHAILTATLISQVHACLSHRDSPMGNKSRGFTVTTVTSFHGNLLLWFDEDGHVRGHKFVDIAPWQVWWHPDIGVKGACLPLLVLLQVL